VKAVLSGFRAIDTAAQLKHYREDLVGEALQELHNEHNINREAIFLQTKYTPIGGQDRTKPLPYDPTDPIMIYVLHSPLPTPELTLEAWRVLIALQDEGKVRKIGLSNAYDVSLLKALEVERQVQVVQNRWYEGNMWDRKVFKYCKENGIEYQSFWTLTGSPGLLAHPDLLNIKKSTNCTVAQALFRIAQLAQITPLSGTTDEQHMKEDVAVESINFSEEVESHLQTIRSLIGAV